MVIVLAFITAAVTAGVTARSQEPRESSRGGPTARQALAGRPATQSLALPRSAGRLITFDIVLANMDAEAGDGAVGKPLKLENEGNLKSVLRFHLSALEEQQAFVQTGALTPRITGQSFVGGRGFGGAAGGQSMPIITDINLGTIAQVVARVEDDGSIVAQINFERSTMPRVTQADIAAGHELASVERILCQTTTRLKPGVPTIVGGRQSQGSDEATRAVIVVTATLPSQ
jgi:hypothetical protein